jgi:hypothetical protein
VWYRAVVNLESLSPLLATCPYPSMMTAIDRGIQGNGYFPGARGFRSGADPTNGVMLLGRDFGLYSYYRRRSSIPNADETMYTWQRTCDCVLLPLAGVGSWATNYLLGARQLGLATGDLRDLVSPEEWQPYEEFCWKFLCRALLQYPKCIVVLGSNNARDLQKPARFVGSLHTFRCAGEEHSAAIFYAPHPSSLRSRVAQERALEWYRRLAILLN